MILQNWIEQGAQSPDEPPPEDPRQHWAYQAPGRPAVPLVTRDQWVRNPVDAFIAASHERQELVPVEPAEKQALYQRCQNVLGSGGVLLNGDEVRPVDEVQYRAQLTGWADHMRAGMSSGTIPPAFHAALNAWIERNVTRFGEPKKSGDDCHETIATQLDYFRAAGFATTGSVVQEFEK